MSKHNKDFYSLKKAYNELFDASQIYLTKYPDAELTHNELREPSPTLGFTHMEGNVKVTTTFELVS
jgi:hypothetical protein